MRSSLGSSQHPTDEGGQLSRQKLGNHRRGFTSSGIGTAQTTPGHCQCMDRWARDRRIRRAMEEIQQGDLRSANGRQAIAGTAQVDSHYFPPALDRWNSHHTTSCKGYFQTY